MSRYFVRIVAILIATFGLISTSCTTTSANTSASNDTLAATYKNWQASLSPLSGVSGSETQAAIAINLATGDTVFCFNQNKKLTPASLTKLFTTSAAISLLGADYQFSTTALWQESHKTLIIQGGCDPTLGSKYFGNNSATAFVEKITEALKQQKIYNIEKIAVDFDHLSTPQLPSARMWEDMGNYYGAAPSALNYNDNSVTFYINSPNEVGKTCTIVSSDPQIERLPNCYVKSYQGTSDSAYVYGIDYQNYYISGAIPAGRTNFKVKGALIDPSNAFAQMLIKHLKNNKITIANENIEQTNRPDNAIVLTVQKSPSLHEICKQTNKRSINLFADAMLLEMSYANSGQGSWDNGIAVLEKFCQSIGCQKPKFYDGSGVSPYTAICANDIVKTLIYNASKKTDNQFKQTLAIAGVDGTLKNFGKNNKLISNRVAAKSGSMTSVVGYAGYAKNLRDEEVAFCIIINHHSEKSSTIRQKIEQWLSAIVSQ